MKERPDEVGNAAAPSAAEKAAAAVRERSAAGQLISAAELAALLAGEVPSLRSREGNDDAVLESLILSSAEIRTLSGTAGRYYYATEYMTEAYATILLNKREGNLPLVAETVRRNAADYGRPVAADLFLRPPFDMDSQGVLDAVAAMAATDTYGDIAAVTTTASGIYLYSTLHMERDHAAMLAEWFDVGEAQNP